MKKSEVKKIITEYKPHKGFFDLSEQPETLGDVKYAEILNIQNFLATESVKFADENVRKNNKSAWEELKALSGQLQAIIFHCWEFAKLN